MIIPIEINDSDMEIIKNYDAQFVGIAIKNDIIKAIQKAAKEAEAGVNIAQKAYQRGLKAGIRVGIRSERTSIIAHIEGKTKEEDEIDRMIKEGEFEPIPYLGETAEEEPNV